MDKMEAVISPVYITTFIGAVTVSWWFLVPLVATIVATPFLHRRSF